MLVQFVQDDPLVHRDIGADIIEYPLQRLLQFLTRAFQEEAVIQVMVHIPLLVVLISKRSPYFLLPFDRLSVDQTYREVGEETAVEMEKTTGAVRGLMDRAKAKIRETMQTASRYFSDG